MTHSYTQMKLRLPPDVHSYIKGAANHQERSLNGHIVFLLKQIMEKEKAPGNDANQTPDASAEKENGHDEQ